MGKLYIQQGDSSFSSFELDEATTFEDQASLLLDVDNDGDLDLYIASGGVENGRKSRYYADRLWINIGGGNWKKAPIEFPRENASCAVAADYDKDGDLDIFVGGASMPESYPLPAESMLWQNNTLAADKPSFDNLADGPLPALKSLGVVRSALWSDYDNDGWQDLLVVGEFMAVTIFRNNQGTLEKLSADKLPVASGMWNSINGSDVDLDGDIDYILGNYGDNSNYVPTEAEPIRVYAEDFDENGIVDPIMTHYSQNREVPVHLRDDLVKQLVSLKKVLTTYKEYAAASITDLVPKATLDKAKTLVWNYSKSACLINNGPDGFQLVPLPTRAQFAPIYGTLVDDFNGDAIPDILAIGNSYGTEVFSGWQDASYGHLMLGNGDGTFKTLDHDTSGFYVDGAAKAMAHVRTGTGSQATLFP